MAVKTRFVLTITVFNDALPPWTPHPRTWCGAVPIAPHPSSFLALNRCNRTQRPASLASGLQKSIQPNSPNITIYSRHRLPSLRGRQDLGIVNVPATSRSLSRQLSPGGWYRKDLRRPRKDDILGPRGEKIAPAIWGRYSKDTRRPGDAEEKE